MAVRNRAIDNSLERSIDVDLAHYVPTVPSGTTARVTVRGEPGSFVAELERNYRWIVEGAGSYAELTGVFGGDGEAEKPETVPEWIVRVLEELCDVREVSVYR
ncbi:hypothetical protein ACFQO4_21005 [Saliphagus sp. GCM10025334]